MYWREPWFKGKGFLKLWGYSLYKNPQSKVALYWVGLGDRGTIHPSEPLVIFITGFMGISAFLVAFLLFAAGLAVSWLMGAANIILFMLSAGCFFMMYVMQGVTHLLTDYYGSKYR